MHLSGTNREKIVKERLREALDLVKKLKDLAGETEKALESRLKQEDGGAFPISWCSLMTEKLLSVSNEVARANGAILVRATEKESMIRKEPSGSFVGSRGMG
jgi:hypothetical protein